MIGPNYPPDSNKFYIPNISLTYDVPWYLGNGSTKFYSATNYYGLVYISNTESYFRLQTSRPRHTAHHSADYWINFTNMGINEPCIVNIKMVGKLGWYDGAYEGSLNLYHIVNINGVQVLNKLVPYGSNQTTELSLEYDNLTSIRLEAKWQQGKSHTSNHYIYLPEIISKSSGNVLFGTKYFTQTQTWEPKNNVTYNLLQYMKFSRSYTINKIIRCK